MVDEVKLVTYSQDQTLRLGMAIASCLPKGAFIALYGELGAGKTALTKGIGAGLNIPDIKSPTFNIVREHSGDLPLFHFDIYRLSSADELYDIGFEDYLTREGAIVMEWAQNAAQALPENRLDIYIDGQNERTFRFIPKGQAHKTLLENILDTVKGGQYADSRV